MEAAPYNLELKGEYVMKALLSRKSVVTLALLMLLSLNVMTWMTASFCAAAPVKDPTIYITGSGSIELTWKSGKSIIYSSDAYANMGGLASVTITPNRGWSISAVSFDGNPTGIADEDGFSLSNVDVKRMISVEFVENGGVDDVDTGANTGAYPDPDVGLIFDNALTDGFAYAYVIGLEHPEQIGESWDIQTTAAFDENVTIYLVCNLADLPNGTDPNDLVLWRTEVVLGDVNLDGIVDATDVSIIANANPNDPNPDLDLTGDGVVNDDDVVVASHNIGQESVWEPLESWVFLEGNLVYVYGVTEHLSVFGVTRGHAW
jgi:hypothetical protein